MEERISMQQGRAEDRIDTKPPDIARLLLQYIEQDANAIIGIFRSRVRKAGLASKPEEVQEAALELLNEVYIEATKTVHSFDPARPPRAWLLGSLLANDMRCNTEQPRAWRGSRIEGMYWLRRLNIDFVE